MKATLTVLTGVLSMSLFAVPLAGEAQPALEHSGSIRPGCASGTLSGGGSRTADCPAVWRL